MEAFRESTLAKILPVIIALVVLVVGSAAFYPTLSNASASPTPGAKLTSDAVAVNPGYTGESCTTTATTCAVTISVAAGSVLVADYSTAGTGVNPTAVTFNAATPTTLATESTTLPYEFLYGLAYTTATSVTVTVTHASGSNVNLLVADFTGTLGGASFYGGTGVNDATSSTLSCSVTTTQADEMIFTSFAASASVTITVGTGQTKLTTETINAYRHHGTTSMTSQDQYYLDTASGAYSSTATSRGTQAWSGACVGIIPGSPVAPTGLAASGVTTTTVPLSWTNPAGNTGNIVLQASYTFRCGTYATIHTSATPITAYTVAGLTAGTEYCFEVEATNSVGASPPSSAITVATLTNAPTNLAHTTVTTTSVELTWTAPSTGSFRVITSYTVLQASFTTSCQAYSTSHTAAREPYTVTGLTSGTEYCFEVEAVDASGASAPSNSITISTITSAPTGLTLGTLTATTVELSWTAPTTNPASGVITSFTVLQATYSSGACGRYSTTYTLVPGSPYTVSGLTAGDSYCFEVEAVDSGGTSAPSNSVFVSGTIPGAPTNLVATTTSTTQIALTWTNPSGSLTDDWVFEYFAGCTVLNVSLNLGSVQSSHVVGGLAASTTYCFTVAANSSGGQGPQSGTANNTTEANVPGAPINLVASTVSSSGINLAWTNPSGTLVNDTVYEYMSDCATLINVTYLGVVATSYAVLGLLSGTTYCFTVSANTTLGPGPQSAPASNTTFFPAPGGPTFVDATTISTSQIDVNWTNPAGTLQNDTVYEYAADCTTLLQVVYLGVVGTTWDFTGLAASTTYCYTVAAATNGGIGPQSAPALNTTFNPAPGAPTGLNATTVSGTGIDLNWTNPAGVLVNETVYEYMSDCATLLQNLSVGGVADVYDVTGLAYNTTYCFSVAAWTNGGEGPVSTFAINTTYAPPPGAPTNASAVTISPTEIDLNWTNPIGTLTNNTIYEYAADCSTLLATIDVGAVATVYDVTGLTPSTTYCFNVTAWDLGGQSNQSLSAENTTFNPVPGAPTLVSATTVSTTQINLAWTNPAGVLVENAVYEYTAGCSALINVTDVAVSTSYDVKGLAVSTTYCFNVSASTNGGEGPTSNSMSATTFNPAPAAPTGLGATTFSDSQINLAWTNPAGTLTDNTVYEYASDCTTLITTLNLGAVATADSVTGLSADTTYCFTVSASTNGGMGPQSLTSSATTDNAPPSAPTGLTPTPTSTTAIGLTWTNPSGTLTDNTVYEYAANCATLITSINLHAVATTYAVTGLTPSTTYCFTVSASTNGGASPQSVSASATTLNPAPSAPTALTATAVSTTGIDLTWTNPAGTLTDNTVYEYNAACTTLITTINLAAVATGHAVTGLTASTTYCFTVTASTNGGTSAPSTSASATTFNPVPSAPTGLTATTVSTTSIDLAWTNPSGTLTDDHVYEYKSDCATEITSYNLAAVGISYTVTGLTPSTTYCFTVTASTNGGEGAPSASASATTLNAAPAAPTGLTATANSTSSINLNWTNPSGTLTDTTVFEYSVDCTTLLATLDQVAVVTSASITGLNASTTYCFTVSATTNGGAGPQSSSASATTFNPAPAAPTNLTAVVNSDDSITLSWTNPSGDVPFGDLTDTFVNVYHPDCTMEITVDDLKTVATTYSVTGLSPDTPYCFTVSAATNGGEGPQSSPVNATTFNPAPAAPTVLAAVAESTSVVNLTWKNPSGTLTYNEVYEYSAGCSNLISSVDLDAVVISYSVHDLSASTTYCFTVSAATNGGLGPQSSSANATTQSGVSPIPAAPTSLVATAASTSVIDLTWANPSGTLTANTVYEYQSDCTTLITSIPISPAATSYTVTGLKASTTYCFTVTASSSGGQGPASATASATTLASSTTSSGTPAYVYGVIGLVIAILLIALLLFFLRRKTGKVTFTESGLPDGTEWSVTVNGSRHSSTSSSITVTTSQGEGSYTIGEVSGQMATPEKGSVKVGGAPTEVEVKFAEGESDQEESSTDEKEEETSSSDSKDTSSEKEEGSSATAADEKSEDASDK